MEKILTSAPEEKINGIVVGPDKHPLVPSVNLSNAETLGSQTNP